MSTRAWLCLVLVVCGCGAAPRSAASTTTTTEPAETRTEASPGATSASAAAPEAPPATNLDASSPAPTETSPEVVSATLAPSIAPASGVTEGLRAQAAILERQCGELERAATQIAALRPLIAPDASGMPPLCVDRAAIEALRITSRSGQAGSHAAGAALHSLDDWCEPFDHWAHPPEIEARAVRAYLQQIDRIIGWMRDIDRCGAATHEERARCENAYDTSSREAADEARRALALLDEHLAELAPVRTGDARFACRTPVLARIEAQRWMGTVARAQLSRLSGAAMTVCERIGVSDRDVREGLARTEAEIDRAESSARAQRRQMLDSLEAMRPYLE